MSYSLDSSPALYSGVENSIPTPPYLKLMFFKQFWHCTPTEHRQKYARYMEQEPHAVCLLADESLQLTEDAITAWHLEKTFR